MRRRSIALLLTLLLLFALLPAQSLALCDVAYSLEDGTLTVSGSGSCGDGWRHDFAPGDVRTLVVEEGVIGIDAWAFADCPNLTDITLPDSLTHIGAYAFSGSAFLADLENSVGGVFYIGRYLICADMSVCGTITVSDGTRLIADHAFSNCPDLTDVVIPDSVLFLGSAFYGCTGLCGISLSNSIAEIPDEAFYNCTSLTELSLPDSVKSIGAMAFCGCESLFGIGLPDGIESIGSFAFHGTEIYADQTNWENGVLYIGSCLIEANSGLPDKYIVKDGTRLIADSAFSGSDKLLRISVPESVISVGDYAFYGCTALSTVYYGGVSDDWKKIVIGSDNESLSSAALHCKDTTVAGFGDIAVNGRHAPYVDAIAWAAYSGITEGYPDGSFHPDAGCTRAQVVTFLWRAAGSPEPEDESVSFVDVKNEGAMRPYYKAILWAAQCGITAGYPDGSFRPYEECTRAQFVTFLWRYMGKPDAAIDNPFGDVGASPYYDAIMWAFEANVTKGYGAGLFKPDKICSRAEVVTFIYRTLA